MFKQSLDKILFLDIETVPGYGTYSDLPNELQHCWEAKFEVLHKRMPEKYADNCTAEEAFCKSAGIYAEFGKIVCISVGFCYFHQGDRYFRTKSFAGDDEHQIISDFMDLAARFMTTPNHTYCGHNIKEFDIPYICRRALANGIKLHDTLQIAGKKPWELNFVDTLDLWKFGDYKNFTSLKTLTALFGIDTPKDDIDGSQVAQVYYQEKNIQRIATYCQKDVLATAQVFCKMIGEPLFNATYIQHT